MTPGYLQHSRGLVMLCLCSFPWGNYTAVSRGRSRNRIGGSSGDVDKKLSDVFADEKMTVNQRIPKTYTILLSFTLMVRYRMHITGTQSMVMSLICKVTHWHFSLQIWLPSHADIWEYFSKKVVPVIRKWQLENVSTGETVSHACEIVEPFQSLNSILESILRPNRDGVTLSEQGIALL